MKVIDYIKSGNVIRLYFGYNKIKDCYFGDNWDDIPYEHNSSLVYPIFIRGYYDIAFPLECVVLEASSGYSNSPYSKNDLKRRITPCLSIIKETRPNGIINDGFCYNFTYDEQYDIYFNDNIDYIKKNIKNLVVVLLNVNYLKGGDEE